MKKIIYLFAFLMTSIVITAQENPNKPEIKDYMTPEQLLKYENDLNIAEMEKKMEQYGKWVGVGGEVGQAINEGLSAVVDVSDKFGKTDVGKFTMVLVAWKVIGKDVVRIILGLLFIITITVMMFIMHRRTFAQKKICVKNPGFLKYPKEYEIVKPNVNWEGYHFVKVAPYPIFFTAAIGITYAIMFS